MLETANCYTPSPGNASTRPDAHGTCAHSDRSALSYQRPPIVPRCSCKAPGKRCEMHGAAKIRPPLLLIGENRQEAVEAVRSPESGGSPMLLERLTAWTLVVVYYTVTCGAIVLGLRGAL